MRIGSGFDIHKFYGIGPIILGGEIIPNSFGILAHSDGDVLSHAIINSIIGALSLGDIGTFFPDTDPSYKDISSRILLRRIWRITKKKGYRLGNLDTTVIVQSPKISPFFKKIKENISEDLSSSRNRINVKANTSENLGCLGRNEGIACIATILLKKVDKDLITEKSIR